MVEAGSRRTRTLCAALADAGVEVVDVMDLNDAAAERLAKLGLDAVIVAVELPASECVEKIKHLKATYRDLVVCVQPEDDHVLQDKLIASGINAAYVIESISPALIRSILTACIRRVQREAGLATALQSTQEALEKRRVVDRARCILMERHGLSEKDAYRQLQHTAMQRGLPMAELARQVLQEASIH